MFLSDAAVGTELTVQRVGGERSFRRRLMELGLVPGTRLEVLGEAPFGGPIELLARGCSLSIRREEAARVAVSELTVAARTTDPSVQQALSAAIVAGGVSES
jgi:Fe2+ transport system protein FeoA